MLELAILTAAMAQVEMSFQPDPATETVNVVLSADVPTEVAGFQLFFDPEDADLVACSSDFPFLLEQCGPTGGNGNRIVAYGFDTGSFPVATVAGVHVATLEFDVTGPEPCWVIDPEDVPGGFVTRVTDDLGNDILDTIISDECEDEVTIFGEPFCPFSSPCDLDLTGDGFVDILDIILVLIEQIDVDCSGDYDIGGDVFDTMVPLFAQCVCEPCP